MVLQFLLNFRSGALITSLATVGLTGGYVIYKDSVRFPHMIDTYQNGHMLPPFQEHKFKAKVFHRPTLEASLKQCMSPLQTFDYHLITGETGCGKSRLVQKVVAQMIEESNGEGAPIYMSVAQGKSFAETLAAAVNFTFDEHISFKFFANFALGIHKFPEKDEVQRLARVLFAIERSAWKYFKETGRPVVIVIDGIDYLHNHAPHTLIHLLEKAKLWADSGIVKLIFVTSYQNMMNHMQHCSWSRAAPAHLIPDLTREEAFRYLTSSGIEAKLAEEVIAVVGRRLNYLRIVCRDHRLGTGVMSSVEGLIKREKDKLIAASQVPSHWKVIQVLRKAPNKRMTLTSLASQTSQDDLRDLFQSNILSVYRDGLDLEVRFESELAEYVVDKFKA